MGQDEVTGDWRKLHDEELHNLDSPVIIGLPDPDYEGSGFLRNVGDHHTTSCRCEKLVKTKKHLEDCTMYIHTYIHTHIFRLPTAGRERSNKSKQQQRIQVIKQQKNKHTHKQFGSEASHKYNQQHKRRHDRNQLLFKFFVTFYQQPGHLYQQPGHLYHQQKVRRRAQKKKKPDWLRGARPKRNGVFPH